MKISFEEQYKTQCPFCHYWFLRITRHFINSACLRKAYPERGKAIRVE